MSLVKHPEMTEANLPAHRSNAQRSDGPVTPDGKANSAAANLRHGFYSQQQDEVMFRMGEDPREYRALIDGLVDDLQPRRSLESELVLRMGRTLWRMRRAERMRDGLALKRIESHIEVEKCLSFPRAAQAIKNLEPYETLQEALRHRDGPSAAEIDVFVKACGQEERSFAIMS